MRRASLWSIPACSLKASRSPFRTLVVVLLVFSLVSVVPHRDQADAQESSGATAGSAFLDAGFDHSLALRTDGSVWAWGANLFGQLGDGTSSGRSTAAQVADLTEVAAISGGGDHSLAVGVDGAVWSWGRNLYGQLGDGTADDRPLPVQVAGLPDMAGVAGGNYHSLAVADDGSVWAWGLNNAGQLGDGTTVGRTSPVQVQGIDQVVAVAGGGMPGWAGHSLALRSDGTVWAWGYNKVGQLGDGSKNHRSTPVQVSGLTDVVAVAAGGDSSYALTSGGTVWAWGDNSYDQLGPDAKRSSTVPVPVPVSDVTAIAAGATHALAMAADGGVWAWGNNNTGQLGHGECGPGTPKTVANPVQVAELAGATGIAGGYIHSLAALSDSTAWGWGSNTQGQLGDGTTTVSCVPVQVTDLIDVGPYVPASLHLPDVLTLEPAEPGTPRYEGGPGLPGLVVEIESAGGISSNQISVRPDRQASLGIAAVAASPAYDITVPRPENVLGATLTLPYDPGRLQGFVEEELAIATYLEDAQMWVPVPGPAVVDTAAKTVTVHVDHLSLYAVVGGTRDDFWTPEAIERLFGRTAVRCVPQSDASDIDVVFMIDTSGSMGSNDPSHQRVDAAQLFVDEMRDDDRASVVSFSSSAVTRIGLTLLDPSGRTSVSNALDSTRFASGGTNIYSAVRRGIDILAANGGGGRLRVGILMTDGQDSSDPASLVGEAVEEAIAIYAVGLGAVDETKLRAVAEGTGGTYQHLDSADQLPELYAELVRDIIDDGTDTDGDGLTDCEERNGLFSPAMLWLPQRGTTVPLDDWGVFSFPDPESPDTDGDGTDDGVEAERVRFDDNPEVARAFQVMVDAGRDTYFRLVSGRPDRFDSDNDDLKDPIAPKVTENCKGDDFATSPFAWDSDGDDLSDGVECANGTDPLTPDLGAYGVAGLAPFTLFTPDRYEFESYPVVPYIFDTRGDSMFKVTLNRDPVFYDSDYNCVRNCAALTQWAADRDDENGWGVCLFGRGDCVDDARQIRDKILEVVEAQGVFDGGGDLREEHVGATAAFICLGSFSDSGPCLVESFVAAAGRVASNLPATQLDPGATRTLEETIGDRTKTPNAGRVIAVTAVLVTIAKLYRDATRTDPDREETIRRALDECYASDVLDVLDYTGDLHPCEGTPMFLPGETDAGAAALNDAAAIASDPTKIVLRYVPAAERDPIVQQALIADGKPSSNPRQWYRQYDPCVTYDTTNFQCDEYPFYSSHRGGPPTTDSSALGSRIRVVPRAQNAAEGTAYGAFTQACPQVNQRQPFLVIPLVGPAAAPTDWICP